jgi:dUTP pyrophosphatase
MKLRIKELNKHNFYGNMVSKPKGDAGIDLYFPNTYNIPKRQSVLIDFEIECEMWTWTKNDGYDVTLQPNLNKPYNCSYQVVPRSSIWRTPIRQSNSIGIIDSGYRGHIMVPVDNHSGYDYKVNRGERLFQIVHPSLQPIHVEIVDELTKSKRGKKGFGSTGK